LCVANCLSKPLETHGSPSVLIPELGQKIFNILDLQWETLVARLS